MKYAIVIMFILLLSGCNSPGSNPNPGPREQAGSVARKEMLSPEVIESYHLEKMKQEFVPLIERAGTHPEDIYREDLKRFATADRQRYYGRGTDVVRGLYMLSLEPGMESLKDVAIGYADFLIEAFFRPEGHFVEYEKCPWLTPETLWYTIPWGTAFHGNDMVDTYALLKSDLDQEQLHRWQDHLRRTGEWLDGNPVTGTYVFNCTMDLCRLLWKIGNELGNEPWMKKGLEQAHELIRRDMDEEGWIHGEAKGVSPHYQLLGADFISMFAWESGDPLLMQTSARCFDLHTRFSTPTMFWNGNFGTRSNAMEHIAARTTTLVQAAAGHPVAGHFLARYGHPSWSGDLDLWAAALSAPEMEPAYKKVEEFPGIEGTVIREGLFQAWFTDYEKSIWAKGFVGLWCAAGDDALFSTLHSLPSRVEKAKLRLGSTADWAGFPHIQVSGGSETYHSHQELGQLETSQGEILGVTWAEELRSYTEKGHTAGDYLNRGGRMQSQYQFKDSTLTMHIRLTDLAGPATLDFHLMRRADQYFALWDGEALEKVKAGQLPFKSSPLTIRWDSGEKKEIIFQLNNNLYLFVLEDLPESSHMTAGMLQESGLHTRNHGGVRLRIETATGASELSFRIVFRVLS